MSPEDHITSPASPEANGEAAVSNETADTSARLARLAELADELGAERLARDARDLGQRLMEGRFYVACIGQFKRGKSTLIGALIGDPILPAGVVPITTVPTVIRFGNRRSARVRFRTGTWSEIEPRDLHLYVSEEHNPENTKGVEGVEVFVPSSLLATGMCLVDTPGLGSIFSGNTAATQAFVPHIDAAIVVVGADPPLAGEELALVEAVGKQVRDLLVVLNKADRTTDAEREAARVFTRKVLDKRLGRPVGEAFEVSATERLEQRGPKRDWESFLEALQALVTQSGRNLIQAAGERGLRRLAEELAVIVMEEREALLSPIEESERRIVAMRKTMSDSQRSLQDLSYLFMAEQHRLSDRFLTRRKEFLGRILGPAMDELNAELRRLRRGFGPAFRREAMRLAQEVAEQHVLPWLATEQEHAEEEYKTVSVRFVGMANDFLKRLSESGIPELRRMPNALNTEQGFRVRSRFSFEKFLPIAMPASPLRYLADIVLSVVGAHKVIARATREFLEHLLETNSTRVQSDVVGRVQESRGQLEAEIRKVLLEVGHIAQRALEHARLVKAAGEAAVEERLCRLGEVETEIKAFLP
jgi:ribosome biogenesis GTPase A